MTEQQTAKPTFCRRCQGEIIFPGQYVIVDSLPYHLGCDRPGFAVVTVTELDGRTDQRTAMLTEAQIKHMVDRFLGWRLPENFQPDAGISFKPTFNDHMPKPQRHTPSGTNLFDANQADAMVRYMVAGMPPAKGASMGGKP